ncbi:MAG: hypothetical protein ACR2P0_10215 [Acidimicrobiales bacterium]
MTPIRRRTLTALVGAAALLAVGCTSSEPQIPTGALDRPDETPSTSVEPAAPTSTIESAIAEPDDPDLAALPGLLVVRDSVGSIVVMRPSGAESVPLADVAGTRQSQPTWSPDGDQIAWSSDNASGSSVSIWNRSTGEVESWSTATSSFFHSFSPDGRWLASLGPSEQAGVGLSMLATTPGSAVQPIAGGQPFYFDWADDGATLVAAVNGTTLAEIDPVSSETIEIATPGALSGFLAPAWVDSSAIVAIEGSVDGTIDVVRADAPEGSAIATADGPVSMSLSPDGTRLAILAIGAADDAVSVGLQTAPQLSAGRLTLINLATGELETRGEDNVIASQWSPDSETIAILQVGDNSLRWSFATGERTIDGPDYLPSQEFLSAYLRFAEQYNHNSTWWSPDSQAFVLTGQIDGEGGVFVDIVDDDAAPRFVSDGDVAFWSSN